MLCLHMHVFACVFASEVLQMFLEFACNSLICGTVCFPQLVFLLSPCSYQYFEQCFAYCHSLSIWSIFIQFSRFWSLIDTVNVLQSTSILDHNDDGFFCFRVMHIERPTFIGLQDTKSTVAAVKQFIPFNFIRKWQIILQHQAFSPMLDTENLLQQMFPSLNHSSGFFIIIQSKEISISGGRHSQKSIHCIIIDRTPKQEMTLVLDFT